jgi:endonuclease III
MAKNFSPARAKEIAKALKRKYRDFAHFNRYNPLEELLFIICSTKTPHSNYRVTFGALRKEFPTFSSIAEAPAEYIAKPMERGGLAKNKAKAIRKTLDFLVQRFGRPTLAPLKHWTDEECESFLTSLPGVGKKVARCVMMYSLGRQVFPVDTHCWRISRRLGWVRLTTKDGHPSPRDMDRLQSKISPDLRFSLHVNMISLGREVCTAHNPKCRECPIEGCCKKIGVAKY